MKNSPQGPGAQIVQEVHAFLEDPNDMEGSIVLYVENEELRNDQSKHAPVCLTDPPGRPIGPSTPLGPEAP